MKAATRKRSKLLSPAGFALVLLLFLFMPFLSAACDVRGGGGTVDADYRGTDLVAGTEPDIEVPEELREIVNDLFQAFVSDASAPEPGAQVLAIIVAVVLVAGIALPFIPRLADRVRLRMFGGAALALAAGVLMIVTQLVAQTNVAEQLTRYARELGIEDAPTTTDAFAEQLVHTGVGFWLSLVLLTVIALASVGYVYRDKLFHRAGPAGETVGSAAPIWQADAPDPPAESAESAEPESPPDERQD
jgi:hypothetical protein